MIINLGYIGKIWQGLSHECAPRKLHVCGTTTSHALAQNFGAKVQAFAELSRGNCEELLLENCQTVNFAAFDQL